MAWDAEKRGEGRGRRENKHVPVYKMRHIQYFSFKKKKEVIAASLVTTEAGAFAQIAPSSH